VKSGLRAAIGFLLAPLSAAIIAAFWVTISDLFLFHRIPPQSELLGFSKLAVAVAYVSTVVFGVPVYFFLRARRLGSLGIYAACGFLIGLFVYELTWPGGIHGTVILTARLHPVTAFGMFFRSLQTELPCGLAGLVAASIFWWLARPDRTAKQRENLAAAVKSN
jgi:hypothetical protein